MVKEKDGELMQGKVLLCFDCCYVCVLEVCTHCFGDTCTDMCKLIVNILKECEGLP